MIALSGIESEDLSINSGTEKTREESSETKQQDYSTTNIQERGVDEADIVKTDGKYIYYIVNDKILIIDINDPSKMEQVANIDYEGKYISPKEIYINDNKLIVLANSKTYLYDDGIALYETTDSIYTRGNIKNKTIAIIYDLTNIKKPKELRKIEIDGSYLSSRMIENNIYFVSNKNINSYPIGRYPIQELKENDYKPEYKDTAINDENRYIDFKNIHYFSNLETANYLTLIGFNINNTKEANIQTFLGAGDTIYSSSKNIYIAKSKSIYDIDTYENVNNITKILKFGLHDGNIEFIAEKDVNGVINNQFSMGENEDGYFRIATTVGKTWDINEQTSNNIYILDNKLNEVGKLEKIAKGEKIYSVRYVKDKAYIVTFKEVDPLFVIDLSDNKNPKILGELKIPGYSTYLHPYDEKHLIGFGYDTKQDGTRITTNGLKMAMFDISDLNNPREMFKINIGDRYTNSNLIYDHKALLFLKEKNIIAFPVYNYAKGKNNSMAKIYEINLEKGFILKGEITHNNSDYQKTINRIIYIKDNYYTLSSKLIKATNINTFNETGRINL